MSDTDSTSEVCRNSLDDTLIALQKSISRVNEKSLPLPMGGDRPIALIIGDIDFELELSCDQVEDRLIVSKGGTIHMKLKGTLNTDMEVREGDEGD
ncbi:hypothetical protein LRP50_18195 [Enterovibrio sp. ZSDZ42]|uniref:Uncharacterized protein n=1 Tax=Enterovibrio gelatinilyticus TaxID=2899819 RepID=A0ABT5R466_9GAMM|nr:hypothetical protein [Enterovibrio sp. ZSDZ42]MDD1795062.1 hypothetical protein [Enterovibrio sp. ZSDZ42]